MKIRQLFYLAYLKLRIPTKRSSVLDKFKLYYEPQKDDDKLFKRKKRGDK